MKSTESLTSAIFTAEDCKVASRIFSGSEYYATEDLLRHLVPTRVYEYSPECEVTQGTLEEQSLSVIAEAETEKLFFVRMKALSKNTLMVREYSGLTGRGVATEFYQKILPTLARECGFRFIVGNNNAENIDFFITELGRVHLSELTEEGFYMVDLVGMHPYTTVQFLYPKDKAIYTEGH